MAFFSVKAGGGLSLKADSTSIPDNSCTVCRYAGFDTVGAITSGRGRGNLNGGNVISGANSVLGGFDGLVMATAKKVRFFKSNSGVYTNTTTSTALDESTNQSATYTTSAGTLKNRVYGLTAPTWGATGNLSGFTYGGYAYLADGTTTQRLNLTTGAPPTVATETWGLQSPGYHELSANSTPLSAVTGTSATTVKVTVANGHGLGLGVQVSPSYPITMNMELVGFLPIGGAPDNQFNGLHSSYAGTGNVDLTVTSSGGTLNSGATYTFTFGGQYEFQAITIMETKDGTSAHPNLSGGSYGFTVTQAGDSTHNATQTLAQTGTVVSGYWRIKFTSPDGTKEVCEAMPYNATATEVQTFMRAMALIGDGGAAPITTPCSVTSATEFTFATTTSMTGGTISGGGAIGFIRQGPTLATSANAGELVSGTYYYAYTFYNGVAESNFSAQVPIDVNTSDAVVLTNVLLGPAGTTERRIYRTDVDAKQLYYVGKITENTPGTAASYTYTDTAKKAAGADYDAIPGDVVSDAENIAADGDKQSKKKQTGKRGVMEAQAAAKAAEEKKREKLATNLGLLSSWTDHDPPPTNLKHVGLLGDTVFGITGSELAFSSGNVEHWPLSNRVKPGRNTSETLQSWVPFDRDCILYTSNGLYRLSQQGLSFDDARFEEIESPVGLAGEWAVAALDGQQGHVFLAKSGLYMFDGARVNEISYPIEPMFTDSSHTDYINPLYMSSAVMVTSRDRMMLFYATTSGGNNRMLWGDFQDTGNPNFTVYSWSYTSAWREKADNYIVAGASDGKVYVLDTGWADSTSGTIDWSLTTKEYQLNEGKPFMLDEVVLDADFAGATTTLTVATRARGVAKSCTFTNTTTGRQRVKLKLPTYMKGEVCKLSISSASDTKRVLYSVGWTFLPMGEP